ncbi:MAG: N-methyl-L-tryptophan oxidase [Actinomycetota bacterium]
MPEDVEFAVIGAGMAGAATARALARAGKEVMLFEQFSPGHKRGSSHGASRIFRFSYHEATYVRMAMGALSLWRELEDEVRRELVVMTGGLDAGGKLDEHIDALRECGATFEVLDGSEASERFPAVSFPAGESVLFQPDAGITRADEAVRAFLSSATAHGARVRFETPVLRLEPSDDHVSIELGDGRIRAQVAVVAAGAWAKPLLATAGIDLPVTPTRETVAYFALADEMSVPTLVDWIHPAFYALADPGRGLKAGLHHAGPPIDPREEGTINEETVAELERRIAERYPASEPRATRAETCLYTNTPDERFILERRGQVVIGSACSGHGFKFAPLTGRRLADLALGAPP